MFETSVVQARGKAAARNPLFLTLSIGAHAAALVGVITMSIAGVTLPHNAPHQLSIPVFMELKPMLGDGGQPKKTPAAAPPQTQKRPAPPAAITAPPTVPEHVVPVATTTSSSTTTDVGPATSGSGNATADSGTPGVPLGSKDGVVPDGPPSTAAPQKIYKISDGVKAPVVVHRVIPLYPEVARRMRMNGFVIVECIIDQTGRVRDARVARSSFAAFEQPAIDAVYQWQFTPGMLGGVPVDTQFDLTVKFQLN